MALTAVIGQGPGALIPPTGAPMVLAADLVISLTSVALPLLLFYAARHRGDLNLHPLLISFTFFAWTAGALHLVNAWHPGPGAHPAYTPLKLLLALTAIPTLTLLWRAIPSIRAMPSQRQLRDANESLARANRELEAFTASVSHDLRSPLTTIAGQAGLLELSLPHATEEQRRRLRRIQGSVKAMSELIDALLALSRISRHTLHRELIDVSALAQGIAHELQQGAPQREVAIHIQPGIHVHGDRRLIEDLLANLLSNAWKFTSRTEHARIELGCQGGGVMSTLHVRDNGAGFDMSQQRKLFKPFQRLHLADEFEGSGVGLATVARIVDRHGGRIWAEGAPEAGATFYFTLPAMPLTPALLASSSQADV